MAEYTAQDLIALNNSLTSADDILAAQKRLLDEDFKKTLGELTERIYNMDYTAQEIHRHGVLLGILLVERKHR
jgi:hypothetical protein